MSLHYEWVLSLTLKADLPAAVEAELAWHLGLGPKPANLTLAHTIPLFAKPYEGSPRGGHRAVLEPAPSRGGEIPPGCKDLYIHALMVEEDEDDEDGSAASILKTFPSWIAPWSSTQGWIGFARQQWDVDIWLNFFVQNGHAYAGAPGKPPAPLTRNAPEFTLTETTYTPQPPLPDGPTPGQKAADEERAAVWRAAKLDAAELPVRPLTDEALAVLRRHGASARLVAHHRLVADVAWLLCDFLMWTWPIVSFDRKAVAFGAATHDVGKGEYRDELSNPGHEHEAFGENQLLVDGIAPAWARFARTHSAWDADDATIEDQIVALADKVWKGKRVEDLENRLVERIAQATGFEAWEIFATLDDFLAGVASRADVRLEFQNNF